MATKRSLYDEDEVALLIERKRIDEGLSVAQAADMAGMKAWSWYKKAEGTTRFSLEEIGRFAAAIGAPRGWPFVEWSAAKWLERELSKKA